MRLPAEFEALGPSGIPFSLAGALRGARSSIALVLSDAATGIVFAVLARQAGLRIPEIVVMSALVYAGSAQFLALGLWPAPLPIVLGTLVVNLRHVMMGASLWPWLFRLDARRLYAALFFLTDESWALSAAAFERGETDRAYLLGSGLALYASWLLGTLTGCVAGGIIRDPAALGLDFAFTAVFAALLAGMFQGRRDLAPWSAAALVALATHWLVPGKWYLLAGGIAGCVVGAVRNER
jgi:4-azaleucine resistance transporter AzlC